MPVTQDRHGLGWDAEQILKHCAEEMISGPYFERRVKNHMTTDFEKATAICDEATKLFSNSMDRMLAAEQKISEASKKTSGNVRKAADDLNSGIQKIERVANFDKLEKAVGLLERAAAALSTLAELEKDGKLERITTAMKA